MRIGIDAKWYFDGPPSGKVVVRNLFNNFIEVNKKHEIVLFLDKRFTQEQFPISNPNLHLEYIWGGINSLSNIFLFPKRAQKMGVDIVIFQNFSPFFGKFKKIAYIHDVFFLSHPHYYSFIERLYFLPIRFLSNLANLIITVSNTEKHRMYQYKFNKPIETVYHGVDSNFKPREKWDTKYLINIQSKYNLPEEYLLFVGRINVRKNLVNLLHALSKIKNNIPLVIVGVKDWKTIDINKIISDLRLEKRVVFTGFLSGKELCAVFSLSRLFCFPSFAESFGLPILEAMSSGIPVIVSNRTCLPEICGDAGNYINPDSPQEIADMIDLLLTDSQLYEEKKKKGLEQANKFTWKKSAQTLLDIIEKVI